MSMDPVLIDADSPLPPSPTQIDAYTNAVLNRMSDCAERRGYASIVIVVSGLFTESAETHTGAPKVDADGFLHTSAWEHGAQLRVAEYGIFAVQSNYLAQIWGDIFMNMVVLARPMEGRVLHKAPEFPCGPSDIVDLELAADTLALDETETEILCQLLTLCAWWGDWSPVPMGDILDGLEATDITGYLAALDRLCERGLLSQSEDAPGECFIHMTIELIDKLLPPKAAEDLM